MLLLNFTPFPIVETERLILRQLQADDAGAIYSLRSDERVNEFIDRPKTTTILQAEKFIDKINTAINNNESLYWAIILKEKNVLIGTICLWNISKENYTAEIGYELNPHYQGKGYMQEALSKVIEFGFSIMQLQTIEAYTHAQNNRSAKLLEKNNFKRNLDAENNQNQEVTNEVIYSLEKKNKTITLK
ncbi:MAG: GNAT family N-acetyltransferase [Fimbriimonadaceae bacterium]|nr:GNAT family N-acetyltransferase [Chitinophagales bacterium]